MKIIMGKRTKIQTKTNLPKAKISMQKMPFTKIQLLKLKKALIIAALSGAITFGSYKGIEHHNLEKVKTENYRKIAEEKITNNRRINNLESFYTDEVLNIYSRLISKGSSRITPEDIQYANIELLRHKGVVYFDPVDKIVILRPYLDYGKTQARAYEVIKEARGFEHLWLEKKVYEPVIEANADLRSQKPNLGAIKRRIEKANKIINKSGGQREIRLEKVQGSSEQPTYRLVLFNKLTLEKTYNF